MVSFAELAHDALTYSKAHKRGYAIDLVCMPRLLAAFRERAADSIASFSATWSKPLKKTIGHPQR